MCPKKATRRVNVLSGKQEDTQRVNLAFPEFLHDWIQTEEGHKLLSKCKTRKELQRCELDDDGGSILMEGTKSSIEQATKFLQFNFDNLQDVEKLKGIKTELSSKLNRAITQFKNMHKVEFSVPSEIVGILVGQQQKKLLALQDKYKVNIRVQDEEHESVKFTVSGSERDVVELIQRKLHVSKHECKLDKKLVSFLIGQKGDRIKTIIENSQLIKIDFDNSSVSTQGGDKVCFLYGNKDAIEEGLD